MAVALTSDMISIFSVVRALKCGSGFPALNTDTKKRTWNKRIFWCREPVTHNSSLVKENPNQFQLSV